MTEFDHLPTYIGRVSPKQMAGHYAASRDGRDVDDSPWKAYHIANYLTCQSL